MRPSSDRRLACLDHARARVLPNSNGMVTAKAGTTSGWRGYSFALIVIIPSFTSMLSNREIASADFGFL